MMACLPPKAACVPRHADTLPFPDVGSDLLLFNSPVPQKEVNQSCTAQGSRLCDCGLTETVV